MTADHEKAEWFADLWRQAVAGHDEQRIHVRGVHYFIMSTDEETTLNVDQLPIDYDPDELDRLEDPVRPPTNCSWTEHANIDKCYDYLEDAATLARILDYVPLEVIHDNKHSQLVMSHTASIVTRPIPPTFRRRPASRFPRSRERALAVNSSSMIPRTSRTTSLTR